MGYHTIRVDTTMGPRPPVPLLRSGRRGSRYMNVAALRIVGGHSPPQPDRLVAIVACAGPVRRAIGVDPVEVLRAE